MWLLCNLYFSSTINLLVCFDLFCGTSTLNLDVYIMGVSLKTKKIETELLSWEKTLWQILATCLTCTYVWRIECYFYTRDCSIFLVGSWLSDWRSVTSEAKANVPGSRCMLRNLMNQSWKFCKDLTSFLWDMRFFICPMLHAHFYALCVHIRLCMPPESHIDLGGTTINLSWKFCEDRI